MLEIALIIGGYLLGSVSSAIIVCRAMGLPDPRTQGSNNPGATNVLRIGGKKAAAITLAGDLLKGLVAVLAARLAAVDDLTLCAVGLAAFLGHLYPLFFRFQGGKGVATALGVLLGIASPVGLAVLGTWLAMAKVFKISSLSALTAATLAPLYTWLITGNPLFVQFNIVVSALLIWRHRSNIRNLIRGSEDRISDKPDQS